MYKEVCFVHCRSAFKNFAMIFFFTRSLSAVSIHLDYNRVSSLCDQFAVMYNREGEGQHGY